jgi:hypothetical protein
MTPPDLPVGIGVRVELELIDESGGVERLNVLLVREEAAALDQGRLGVNTPLGQAIRGKRVGRVLDYCMGDICQVRIVRVEPGEAVDEDTTARRQAVIDEARRKAEQTNAEMFAASFSGKWGDYDLPAARPADPPPPDPDPEQE